MIRCSGSVRDCTAVSRGDSINARIQLQFAVERAKAQPHTSIASSIAKARARQAEGYRKSILPRVPRFNPQYTAGLTHPSGDSSVDQSTPASDDDAAGDNATAGDNDVVVVWSKLPSYLA